MFILVIYLSASVMSVCRAFRLVFHLAPTLRCGGDYTLRILFSHLYKVIQVHQLAG